MSGYAIVKLRLTGEVRKARTGEWYQIFRANGDWGYMCNGKDRPTSNKVPIVARLDICLSDCPLPDEEGEKA